MKNIRLLVNTGCLLFVMAMAWGCAEEKADAVDHNLMRFDVVHPAEATATRATATKFEAADRIGLFITEAAEPLQPSGNYVNNALLIFNGTSWTPSTPVYYNNGTYNAYAYYPYRAEVTSVDDFIFEVPTNQTVASSGSTLGGYEAADFLWTSQAGVQASASPVSLTFKHRMSRVVVRLIKGQDYEGDIPADARVYIHNTVTSATIDLAAGMPTVNPHGTSHSIEARSEGNQRYAAIVVPQRLVNRRPLVEVVMKGVSYMMESAFVFKPGMQHTVMLVISKNPEQVKIEIGGEIENWN